VFLTVGNPDFVEGLLDTTAYLASAPSPPSVMTTSYGNDENQFSLSDAQFVFALELILVLTTAPQQEHLCWIHGARCSWHLGKQCFVTVARFLQVHQH
jgi:hypothetical protein